MRRKIQNQSQSQIVGGVDVDETRTTGQLYQQPRRAGRAKKKISELKSASPSGVPSGVNAANTALNSKIKSQNQANIQKLQETRFFIKEGLQEFKAKYEEEQKIESSLNSDPVSVAQDPKPQNVPLMEVAPTAEDKQTDSVEIPESVAAEVHPEPQTELAYDIPPEENQTIVEPNDWAHTIHMNDFLPAWEEFIDSQSVRISTLLKIVKPEIQGSDFVLTVSGRAQQEGLDSIRFPLTRYVNEKTNGKLTKVVIKLGELQEAESRPYTEKEKLEYLLKKKPVLADIIKKLELRIP